MGTAKRDFAAECWFTEPVRDWRSGLATRSWVDAIWTGVDMQGHESAKIVLTGGVADRRTTRKLFSLVD